MKTEPSAYPLSNPSTSQFYLAKSPSTHEFQAVENRNHATISTTGQPLVPCSRCFQCQNDQQCQNQSTYFNNYPAEMNRMPFSAISSASGLLATHAPNAPFPPPEIEPVIAQYMRSMLRREAFITPPQSLSPPGPPQEQVTSSYWTANIDPHLPPLDPAVSYISSSGRLVLDTLMCPIQILHNVASYPTWSSRSDDIPPSVQTHRAESSPADDANSSA